MKSAETPRVPIVRPSLGDEEVAAAARVIRSGWITQGPEVAAFEGEFAASVGAPHAVAVSNCTVAIELALRAVGIRPGDDVVTVSHSFIATANAVVAVGARPVFVDVRQETLGMDPAALRRARTGATRAILCVHQVGVPCNLREIVAIGEEWGVPVVEDAACAIGSEILWDDRWERIGRPRGAVACFSLHPRKVVTTGDGGMLTTGSESLAHRFRLLRQHAMTVSDTIRHETARVVFEDYVEPAFNFRMTDIQAAVGRPQLARLSATVNERRRLAERYCEVLRRNPVLRPLEEESWWRSNWQSFPVMLREGCKVGQIEAMQHLMDAGVACKRGISNAHQELAYRDQRLWACGAGDCAEACQPGQCRKLTNSEWLRNNTVLLPLFHGMTDEEQDRVLAACAALHRPRR